MLIHEAGFLRNADHRPHRIEHIDEQEGEDHGQHVPGEDLAPLELAEDRSYAVGERDHAGEMRDGLARRRILDEHADDGRRQDTPEDTAADMEHHQHAGDHKADDGQQARAVGHVAQRYQGRVAVDDQTGVLQADEGDEQADTGTDGMLEAERDGIQDPSADLGQCEDDENDTFNQDGGQGELPTVSHRQADGKHEEGVEAHAGSQRKRFLGPEGHHQRGDDGSQGRRRENGTRRHSGQRTEDARIDGQDVGHRQERRQAGDQLGPDGVLRRIESEGFGQEITHSVWEVCDGSGPDQNTPFMPRQGMMWKPLMPAKL